MDSIRLSQVKWSNGVWCLSSRAVKQVSQMDQIDQMQSNGLHSTKPSQMVKWCLVLVQSGCKESESNGSNRSNGVEWTPVD